MKMKMCLSKKDLLALLRTKYNLSDEEWADLYMLWEDGNEVLVLHSEPLFTVEWEEEV